MKKHISLFASLILTVAVAACSDSNEPPAPNPSVQKLSTPVLAEGSKTETSLAVEWQPVEHAALYFCTLDGAREQTVRTCKVTYDELEAGEYVVSVTAMTDDTAWAASDPATIRITVEVDESGMIRSEAFDKLAGEWTGTQTVKYATGINPETLSFIYETTEWTFDVTIMKTVGEKNYRRENYLVCLGLGDFAANGDQRTYEQLIAEGFSPEKALEAFGPKWFLNLKEDKSIVVDATTRFNVLSWYVDDDLGPMYLLGGAEDKYFSDYECELPVILTGDNELRVGSVEYDGKTWTPSVFQWHPKQEAYARNWLGVSDIVLRRM